MTELLSYLDDRDEFPPGIPHWNQDRVLDIHRAFVRSRVLDECCAELQRRGRIALWSPTRGLEAHVFGALMALQEPDWVFADVRTASSVLYRGLDLRSYLAQLLGTAGALNLGHSSSGEICSRPHNFVSVSSPLGSQVVHCAGTAHAMKAKGRPEVSFCWFGAGAAATGDFHVGLNLAGVSAVPAVFYLYTSSDPAQDRERLSGSDPVLRAEGYGIEGQAIDGSDVFAVYGAVSRAVTRARRGGGPTFLVGHTGGPSGQADPLVRLEAHLTLRGLDPAAIRADVESRMREELRRLSDDLFAGPRLAPESLFEEVTARPSMQLREQRDGLIRHRARWAEETIV